VLERILELADRCDYDFRVTANPHDPLKRLFGEWVEYYRLKWAIARVLQPTSILEVGVRYGYSAATFLNACPESTYLGIDLDSDVFGGVKGAMRWAKEITRSFRAEFIVSDTQTMARFPGESYDLIHLDGQQDGDSSWHDLQLAIRQARWILVDGYFWTSQNFLSISHFLQQNRDAIRFYGVIPGYAGELLIQVSPQAREENAEVEAAFSSGVLRETYSSSYFLQDCGGFEQYNRNGGKYLEDERLQVVAAVAMSNGPQRVLDLGCGRGELAHFFAGQGAQVTAADYSQAAIQICEKTFEGEPELRDRVQLLWADVCDMPLTSTFDAVTASDVIEHLSPDELDGLYARVSQHLSQGGLFVVHTYPNLWLFQYDYARKRRIASSVGAYLPPEPRTRYELMMHINEQSPRVLKRSLQRHFEHVVLWFGEPGRPARSLLEKMSHRDIAGARDLYAVAAHSPIDLHQLQQLFVSTPILPDELSGIRLEVCAMPAVVEPGELFYPLVEIVNGSRATLKSGQPNPVHISYHWYHRDTHDTVVFEGERTTVAPPLAPGARRRLPVRVLAPSKAGDFLLRLTLVQESVYWFDMPSLSLSAEAQVSVGAVQEAEATLASKS